MAIRDMGPSIRQNTGRWGGRTYTYSGPRTSRPVEVPSVTTILKNGLAKPALVGWGIKGVAEYAVEHRMDLALVTPMMLTRPHATLAGSPWVLNEVLPKVPDEQTLMDRWYTQQKKMPTEDGTGSPTVEDLYHEDLVDEVLTKVLKGAPHSARDAAGAVGSAVHDWLESTVLGHKPAEPNFNDDQAAAYEGCVQSLRSWLDVHDLEWEMSEVPVFSLTHGYAGTLDAVVSIDGTATLLDLKTAKGVYGDNALQLAAYTYADFAGLPNGDEVEIPDVEALAVLHVRPRLAKLYEVRSPQTMDALFDVFLKVKSVFEFVEGADPWEAVT